MASCDVQPDLRTSAICRSLPQKKGKVGICSPEMVYSAHIDLS